MPEPKKETAAQQDIRVDRKVITKVAVVNPNNSNVIEITMSMFVIPNSQRDMSEYEEQIERITSYAERRLRQYVREENKLFDNKCILETTFSSANLRKGYNKSVQFSVFVKHKPVKRFTKLRRDIKETIQPFVKSIREKVEEEDFKCYKRRQKINVSKS